ncbi:MAG: hypothetical protein JO257_10530 [Deltaproteobacteria bacterium]|nr:hypothetical protein [Deltaproteobacteria bacterium]
MEKRLVEIGNSVGFIVDRALCKLLRVTKGSVVDVSTDGRRIVIEPRDAPTTATPKTTTKAPQTVNPRRLLRELMYYCGGPPPELHEQLQA